MRRAAMVAVVVTAGCLMAPAAGADVLFTGGNPASDIRSALPSMSAPKHFAQPPDRDGAATARTAGFLVRDVVTAAGQPPGLFPEGATEPSIAVDPNNPAHIAVTAFYDFWYQSRGEAGRHASIFYSADGGSHWTRQDAIPPGPGVNAFPATFGPCDQTIDYGNHHQLVGTFLVCTRKNTWVITGSTTDPTHAAAWKWCAGGSFSCPARPPQPSMDQPQLLVNQDPQHPAQDNVYVAYDNFYGLPGGQFASASHVAVAQGTPLRFINDVVVGAAQPLATNPGLRLGKDPRTGAMYALYERSATTGSIAKKIVTYMVNRSTDGGHTWSLNGHADGIAVATGLSEQAPYYKFCNANALLGGVDALDVDPKNGDVYVAYGTDRQAPLGNEIMLRRLTTDAAGHVTVGPSSQVSSLTESALPSVAVADDGTVGVLFDSCAGKDAAGLPRFTAQLARSHNRGRTFAAVVLSRFSSPLPPSPKDGRQRVLGDYQQLKAVGSTLFGVFSGNRTALGGSQSTTDPVFFRTQ